MRTITDQQNYFETFEYSERIKHLTDEILGCYSRITVFIEENHLPGFENTLSDLLKHKLEAIDNYRKLESDEIILPTKEKAENFAQNLVKNWHQFHDFEKSVKETLKTTN